MKEAKIILNNGDRIKLSEYQLQRGLQADKVGEFFSVYEKGFNNEYFCVSEILLDVLHYLRLATGPVVLNSVYRSEEKQKNLKHGAKKSTHVQGMAADIDTNSIEETKKKVQFLEKIAKDMGIKIRLGFNSYHEKGMSFIHIDVGPEYFAPGKPYHSINHPWQWEVEARW
jgi:uncharacterized protein YcbK (DUF882 family)